MEKGRSSDNLARQSFDIVGDEYRVCVIGNLNRWVGDKSVYEREKVSFSLI